MSFEDGGNGILGGDGGENEPSSSLADRIKGVARAEDEKMLVKYEPAIRQILSKMGLNSKETISNIQLTDSGFHFFLGKGKGKHMVHITGADAEKIKQLSKE